MTNHSRNRSASTSTPSNFQADILSCDALEPRLMLSTVQLFAAGTTGAEAIELEVAGTTVQTWNNLGSGAYSGDFVSRSFTTNNTVSADDVRIRFTNDLYDEPNNVDRNVRIDRIVIDGTTYQTEDPSVFSTGTWLPGDGVQPGNRLSEYLHTDGFFQYAGSSSNGSSIQVTARGSEGTEQFNLLIDEQVVRTWNATTADATYQFNANESVTADRVRIEFTNDQYDPANGIDRNLIVDSIDIDGTTFQTESPSTFATGTWVGSFTPGFHESETLHGNGYFQFDAATQSRPGNIGFTIDSIAVDENAGLLNVIVFRADGADGSVSVNYSTSFGTANSNDINAISGTLTFGNGVTGQQLAVPIVNDSTPEGAETFSLNLSNPTGGASLGTITTQTVTIRPSDQITAGIIFEDSFEGTGGWTTNASGTDTATTGFWAAGAPQTTSSGGATMQLGAGHTGSRALFTGLAAGGSVGAYDIDNGVTSVLSPEIALPANGEVDLSFEYSLAYLGNSSVDDYFRASIVSNGTTTEIYYDHAHDFVQAASWQEVTVDISQFAGQNIQILFEAADEANASLVEAAVDDVVVEVLANGPGTFNVDSTGVNLDESAGVATMTVTRTSGRTGTATVSYRTVAGTAGNNDFVPVNGTLSFADGQSSATVDIQITDDTQQESLESFVFEIFGPTGGAGIGTNNTGTVTIVDNDNTVADFLPDMVPIASTLTERLSIDTNELPGRTLLRFSTEVANAGDGPLEIWGGSTTGDSQQVFQRVYQEDGSSRDRLAGEFVYHPGHGHIHFEGFATYDLKLVGANGDVIASGGKTSFCLINIRNPFPEITSEAGLVHGRGGNSCGQIQGISTGYSDVYSASLDDQWIDVTDVADGTYYLEIAADPDNNVQETNENNNVARIQVTILNGTVNGTTL